MGGGRRYHVRMDEAAEESRQEVNTQSPGDLHRSVQFSKETRHLTIGDFYPLECDKCSAIKKKGQEGHLESLLNRQSRAFVISGRSLYPFCFDLSPSLAWLLWISYYWYGFYFCSLIEQCKILSFSI